MRVIVVTPDFPPATGGIQRLMGELVERSTWQSLVVTLSHPDATAAPGTYRLRTARVPRRGQLALLNAAAVRKGRQWRPDAILCGHIAVSPGAIALGQALRVPVIQYVYAMEMAERPRTARFAVTRAAVTIAISRHTARLALNAGAPAERLMTIEQGVALEAVTPRTTRGDQPTILTVARLSDRYKGFDVLLRALPLVRSRVPEARWVVVGDGALRSELEATAKAWGLSAAVRFVGFVTDGERDAWFDKAHVFAMPSRVPAYGGGEGYGLVYLEAGLHELPCVAGDAGAVSETVVHEETGILVDARDHVALADALVALLMDPVRSARLGRAGRERALARSWERMVCEVEAVVERITAVWPAR
jgi:phosphatidylinositol alpha-1,6-mannosyltransferase